MSSDDETCDLPAAVEDAVSTGAAADSADCDERLKGLPRLLTRMSWHSRPPIKTDQPRVSILNTFYMNEQVGF